MRSQHAGWLISAMVGVGLSVVSPASVAVPSDTLSFTDNNGATTTLTVDEGSETSNAAGGNFLAYLSTFLSTPQTTFARYAAYGFIGTGTDLNSVIDTATM